MRRALSTGVLTALGVLGCFGAYAYLAPATYRTTAIVVAAPASPETAVPAPLEAARSIHLAVLDEATVAELARARARGAVPDAKLTNAVRASLQVETLDGRTFELSCTDASAEHAAELCNRLARRAVEKIPTLFGEPAAAPTDSERLSKNPHADELIAFLAAHPELTSEPSEAPKQRGEARDPARDPAILALRAERAELEARLATGVPTNTRSDNPYADPAALDPEVPRLRRRLAEVTNAIQARRNALSRETAPAAKRPSDALRTEWQELLRKASAVPAPALAKTASTYSAQLALEAPVPSTPVLPDRQLLLIVGTLIGLGCGGLTGVARHARDDRAWRRASAGSSSPPLSHSGGSVRVEETKPLSLLLPAPSAASARAMGLSADELARTAYDANVWDAAERFSAPSVPAPRSNPEGGPARASQPPSSGGSGDEREVSRVDSPTSGQATPGVTQTFGTPIDPVLPRAARSSGAPHDTPQRESAPANTGYSYVRSVPPEVMTNGGSATPFPGIGAREPIGSAPPKPISSAPPKPISSAPPGSEDAPGASPPLQSLRSRVLTPSGFPAAPEPFRSITEPPVSEPLRSHVTVPKNLVISPQPAPEGWAPDPSLVPAARRALCKELYALGAQSCFVVGVTGVRGASEDTPRVAAELALALAEAGDPRILLLEGNLQRPSVHRTMRVTMPLFAGFSEQLEARVRRGNQRAPWTVVACSASLHVLAEGMMRLPELVLSKQFEDAVEELRDYYDMIILDGPLTSAVAASRAVNEVVDGIVLVCPKAGPAEIAEASAQFSHKRFSTVLAAG